MLTSSGLVARVLCLVVEQLVLPAQILSDRGQIRLWSHAMRSWLEGVRSLSPLLASGREASSGRLHRCWALQSCWSGETIAFTVWKFVGAAYLGYLGLRSLIANFKGNKSAAVTTPAPQVRQLGEWVAFRQGLLNNLLNPKAGAIFATVLPPFISPGDPLLRLVLMMLAYEAILLSWLNLYGSLVSRAGQSRFGTRVRTILQGVTGVVLIALGVRLAFEQK